MGESFAKGWPVKAVSLALTENCSLRCEYCFCGEKTTRNLDEQTGRDVIDWLLRKETSGDEKRLQIDFWGGEPTLQWDLAKSLMIYGNQQAQKAGKQIRWNMTTNGVHMTEALCKDVALAGVSFMLSFDGTKEIQDKHRPLAGGGSSYDVIVANIPHMKSVYGRLRARVTVREEDVSTLYQSFLHINESLGIPEISSSLAHETAWEYESLVELERQMELIANWYIEKKRQGDEALWVKFIEDGIGRLLYPRKLSYFCGAGRGYLGISVNGVIYPCHRFCKFTDERPWQEQPFAIGTIYEGLTKPQIRDAFIKSAANLPYCSGCDLAKAGTCQGSCYAVNWVKSGKDIVIPAHSGCREMHIAQKIATRVYNQLIGVPAFRRNLIQIAKNRVTQRGERCNQPGFESLYLADSTYLQESVRTEMDVLRAAMASISEAVAAATEVIQNGLSERQRHLELLAQIDSLAGAVEHGPTGAVAAVQVAATKGPEA